MVTVLAVSAISLSQISSIYATPDGLVPHDPLYIDGNAGFTPANGVTSGSGTENDPYIIENWDISAENANGIGIRNTTVYFIIRNCVAENGGSSYYGIYFDNVQNGRVENCTCSNNRYGIYLYLGSSHNTLTNNTCVNNITAAINLWFSSINNLSNNTCSNSYYGIRMDSSSHNTLANNTCVNNGGNGIFLLSSSDFNILSNNTCKNNGDTGISLYQSPNTLSNNICENNGFFGISLDLATSTLSNNTCVNNGHTGIKVYFSTSFSILENNTCSNNLYGIYLQRFSYNTLSNNTCVNNSCGIFFDVYSDNNTITNCTFENNGTGILFGNPYYPSKNNSVYNNNFINNENQARDECSNYWDNGYPSGGNYWSDYTGIDNYGGKNQDIPGSDNIGDTPYYILGDNNRDRYPLMDPSPFWTGTATFKLENMYKVDLVKDLQLNTGSTLVVKFYTYTGDNQGMSVIENFVPPITILENENVPHPSGLVPVEIVRLVLTTGNTANEISTIASFTATRSVLASRYLKIKSDYVKPGADKPALAAEYSKIKSQYVKAPS